MNYEPIDLQFHDWDADEWREEEAARAERATELERAHAESIVETTPRNGNAERPPVRR